MLVQNVQKGLLGRMGWRGTWMGSIDKCDRKPFKLKGTLVAHIRKRHKDDPEAMEAIHKIQPNMKRENEFDEGLEDATEETMNKFHTIQMPFISKLPPMEMQNINPNDFNPRGRPPVSSELVTQTPNSLISTPAQANVPNEAKSNDWFQTQGMSTKDLTQINGSQGEIKPFTNLDKFPVYF